MTRIWPVTVLALVLLAGTCAAPSAAATTYLAVKLGDTIVVGADSCSTLMIDHARHVPGPNVCKIHECAPHTYSVYAGTPINSATGIRFDQIVIRACGQGGTPSQVGLRMRSRLVTAARKAYAKDKQALVSSATVFGASKKGAFLLSRSARVNQDGLYEDPINDCPEGCDNKYVMGGYQEVMKRLINAPEFWVRNGLEGGVRVLLTEEIRADTTHEIAFPLSTLYTSALPTIACAGCGNTKLNRIGFHGEIQTRPTKFISNSSKTFTTQSNARSASRAG